jgi:hypothetical protein
MITKYNTTTGTSPAPDNSITHQHRTVLTLILILSAHISRLHVLLLLLIRTMAGSISKSEGAAPYEVFNAFLLLWDVACNKPFSSKLNTSVPMNAYSQQNVTVTGLHFAANSKILHRKINNEVFYNTLI